MSFSFFVPNRLPRIMARTDSKLIKNICKVRTMNGIGGVSPVLQRVFVFQQPLGKKKITYDCQTEKQKQKQESRPKDAFLQIVAAQLFV
jgi:hypothetical protein